MPGLLVTGAAGYIGRQLLSSLSRKAIAGWELLGCDIEPMQPLTGVRSFRLDAGDPKWRQLLRAHNVEVVIHLASMVTPPHGMGREKLRQLEVVSTEKLLEAAVGAGVRRFVYTSSGAAYGYHPDNAAELDERSELRGNYEFPYCHHKLLVEQMLAQYRQQHPELEQLVFRIGTILGADVDNQITRMFDRQPVLTIAGVQSPFTLVWDQDIVELLRQSVTTQTTGIFNVSGDGVVTLQEMAGAMNLRTLAVPTSMLKGALQVLKGMRLTAYGPEQVSFLRYRPVLNSQKLKDEFAYRPRLSSRQVLDVFVRGREARQHW